MLVRVVMYPSVQQYARTEVLGAAALLAPCRIRAQRRTSAMTCHWPPEGK